MRGRSAHVCRRAHVPIRFFDDSVCSVPSRSILFRRKRNHVYGVPGRSILFLRKRNSVCGVPGGSILFRHRRNYVCRVPGGSIFSRQKRNQLHKVRVAVCGSEREQHMLGLPRGFWARCITAEHRHTLHSVSSGTVPLNERRWNLPKVRLAVRGSEQEHYVLSMP